MGRTARGRRATTPVALAASLLLLAASPPAEAASVYRIKTAPSPTTGAPIQGGGSWIVNKGNGYYLGRAYVGSEFAVHKSTSNHWHYGRAMTTVNMCGWAIPGSMEVKLREVSDSCSDATQEFLSHRRNIGKHFNAPAHAADNTSYIYVSNCPFYFNYFYGTGFPSNGGRWNGYVGNWSGWTQYRFTTLDDGARVVRVDHGAYGWGFMPSWCAGTTNPVYNDND